MKGNVGIAGKTIKILNFKYFFERLYSFFKFPFYCNGFNSALKQRSQLTVLSNAPLSLANAPHVSPLSSRFHHHYLFLACLTPPSAIRAAPSQPTFFIFVCQPNHVNNSVRPTCLPALALDNFTTNIHRAVFKTKLKTIKRCSNRFRTACRRGRHTSREWADHKKGSNIPANFRTRSFNFYYLLILKQHSPLFTFLVSFS